MSAIALNNRVTTYSDAVFVSCSALPIQQMPLNFEEMADVDGLWDWGDFASETFRSAVVGAAGAAVTSATTLWVVGPGYLPSVGTSAAIGFVGGAMMGAGNYAYGQIIADN